MPFGLQAARIEANVKPNSSRVSKLWLLKNTTSGRCELSEGSVLFAWATVAG